MNKESKDKKKSNIFIDVGEILLISGLFTFLFLLIKFVVTSFINFVIFLAKTYGFDGSLLLVATNFLAFGILLLGFGVGISGDK